VQRRYAQWQAGWWCIAVAAGQQAPAAGRQQSRQSGTKWQVRSVGSSILFRIPLVRMRHEMHGPRMAGSRYLIRQELNAQQQTQWYAQKQEFESPPSKQEMHFRKE